MIFERFADVGRAFFFGGFFGFLEGFFGGVAVFLFGAIRELGRSSREKIETFLQRSVYLDLWVKTLPGWRNKASALGGRPRKAW